ncbi:MAG: [protein-PII] uridylyltransferase [Candidatus Binataceae bacterium]
MNAAAPGAKHQAAPPKAAPRGEAGLLAEFAAGTRPGTAARECLEAVRAELFERHIAGGGGEEIVRAMTAAMDDLVRALFRYADADYGRKFPRLHQRLAIVARGGYGRGELNPYSDVDLLFLHDYRRGPYEEIVTETILHALWDAGLTVGHGVRTAKDCVRIANEDLKEKTALLDARLLCGDANLYAALDQLLIANVLNRNQDKFFKAKLEESRTRHAQYGDSIYLLEPQIKDGEGGLRDLHTAMWLAKVKYKVHSIEELVQRAVISDREAAEIVAARSFLWRVRNSLHFIARRHFDQLTFEMQEKIEPMLGIASEPGQAAGSGLMRAYYQQAGAIHRFAEGLIARVTEHSPGGRFFRRKPVRTLRPGVIVQQDLLSVSDPDLFKNDPLNLIAIYADCQAQGVGLSGSAYQMVRDNLALIGETMRNDPRTGAALMEILAGRSRVAATLEAMHLSGVLGAIIPEFGNLYARVLHDLYHIYTVDRHSLAGVRELERLRAGEFKNPTPLLTEVAREFDRMPLVFLTMLLHDIGKGHGHDHHERGAELAREVSRRLGLDAEEADLVVFLVRNHLVMSQGAQKGDLNDEATIAEFARLAGSIDRLKALYLLTYADMRAVAPKVYNNWRDMLLSELYMRALKMLEQGDREAVDPARRLATVKAAVREQLAAAEGPAGEIESFLAEMPDRYFLTVPESDMALHFDLMRALPGQALVARVRHYPELEFSEFIAVTPDRPGLFSMIAGALTANSLNILSARIVTRTNGAAMDVFRVSHPEGTGEMAMEEERWLRVERDLERAITGEVNIVDRVAAAHRTGASRKFVRHVPAEVTIDNRSSEQFTVIDVFTQDRIGLLFAITHTLFNFGLLIHFARISTNGGQALDVFYVSDRVGRKIEDLERMRELRAALIAQAEENPGREERPG